MRILKKIVLFAVVLVGLLAGIGMLLPRKVHVERAIDIGAPQATVFALVDGYKMFNRWSPWHPLDPDAKYTYEGPDFGVGAKMSWASEKKELGSGSQRVIESRPPEQVQVALDFGDGGGGISQWDLTPEAGGTHVVWSVDVDMGAGPVGRWFGLLMDRFIGNDYEKGLAGLKTVAESLPGTDFGALAVEAIEAKPVTVAFIPATSKRDDAAIASAIGAAYGQVATFMKKNALQQAGAAMTVCNRLDDAVYEFDAAIPVDRAPAKEVPADSPVKVRTTYAGRALKAVHKGSYHGLEHTYRQLEAWTAAHGYDAAGPAWEEYVSDPGNTAEADLITNIYMPVK
jgi:effector-binding domain-containing protein